MAPKNPHAVALGRLGGKRRTKAQQKAARENGKLGGRPPSLCPKCGKRGKEHRWYRGERHCPPKARR